MSAGQVLDFNAELHARPSLYFDGPAFVEHAAVIPSEPVHDHGPLIVSNGTGDRTDVLTQVEHHAEFITVTRVHSLSSNEATWPTKAWSNEELQELTGAASSTVVCRVGLLVSGPAPEDPTPALKGFGFSDNTAVSFIGDGAAMICSDFRVHGDGASRIVFFNKELNRYRLGRRVRRILEIETYRAMSLLALPEARRIGANLREYDSRLVSLTSRNLTASAKGHKQLLEEISELSSQVISATASTRNRFGATAAYAQIVDERIQDLREGRVPGFQRYGVFISRRFRPAVRTCAATSLRLEQLSHATMHLIDLLQTRIQVEIEYQNAVQIQAMAERAATQVKIQRAVEGFSIIAISYYLIGLLKTVFETLDHVGYHLGSMAMLVSIPVVLTAVFLSVFRVKHALASDA